MNFPDGRRFAFTIMDDTDVATVANVEPVYQLLGDLGFRTTKTVWPCGYPDGDSNFADTDTLEDPAYVAFIRRLEARGFEIAYHGATMESSTRERTQLAFDRFKSMFGRAPSVYANHSYNQENLYWGLERIDDPILKFLYAWFEGRPRHFYQGHRSGSAWYWGDLAREITYIRNLTCGDINLARFNPSMPYHDPARPLVNWWFSANDAESVREFNALITDEAQERLEREGGICIVATHLGKGYTIDGVVHPETRRLLEQLSRRNGWFVPCTTLLDHLRAQRGGASQLPGGEWRRMQWRWAFDLLKRKIFPPGRAA